MKAWGFSGGDEGGLYFEISESTIQEIEKALGDLKSESGKVLKNAVNATSKEARTMLEEKAQEAYTAKKSALNKDLSIKKASTSKPVATINSKGAPLEIRDFKTTAPRTGVKAKVAAEGTLKLIQSQHGRKAKAFLTTFGSGHKAVVQRQEGKEYKTSEGRSAREAKWGKGSDMTQIKKLLSISAPKMLGDEKKVFGVLRPQIYELLSENIEKEIAKVVGK